MTIALTQEQEERLKAEAARRGLEANELAQQLIDQGLRKPNESILALLRKWEEEDATDDPEEIARRQEETEEFMHNLAKNRIEMEGPNARKLWP